MAQAHHLRKELKTLTDNIEEAFHKAFQAQTGGDDRQHLVLRKKYRDDAPDNGVFLRFWSGNFYVGPDYTRMLELCNQSIEDQLDILSFLEGGSYKEYQPK